MKLFLNAQFRRFPRASFFIRPPFLVGAFFLFVYLISTNQNFSFDAVTNAIACEAGEPVRWFHPNHPLYPALGVLWFRLETFLGYDGLAIYSLARFNSIAVAFALFWLAWRTGRLGHPRGAVVVSAFLGATYAVWHYAVDGRAVGFSVLGAVLLVGVLVRCVQREQFDERTMWGLAGVSVFYTLSHGIGVFHVLPVAWFLWRRIGGRQGVRVASTYVFQVAAACAMFLVSIYVAVVHPWQPIGLFRWVLGYAGFDGVSGALTSTYWVDSVPALLRGLWAGWSAAFHLPFYGESLLDRAAGTGFGVLALGAVAWAGWVIRRAPPGKRDVFWCLIAWGVLVTLFLAFWSPGQEGFRLHVLVPWGAAVAIAWVPSRTSALAGAMLAVLLFGQNLVGAMHPAGLIQNNRGYQLLREAREQMEPGDLLLGGGMGFLPEIGVLLPYFFRDVHGGSVEGRLFSRRETSLIPLRFALERTLGAGQSVFVAADVFEADTQRLLQSRFGLSDQEFPNFLDAFSFAPAFSLSHGPAFWRVLPKTSADSLAAP